MNDSFSIKGQVKWIKSSNGIVVAESDWQNNQIVANSERGLYLMLDRLTGDNTHSMNIRYAEIGTDNTAPTTADIDLGAGVTRASLSGEGFTQRSDNMADFRFFFPSATTPNNTYNEFGMFVDGSQTLSTGQLFNRILFSTPIVKATGEDHTVVGRITGSV